MALFIPVIKPHNSLWLGDSVELHLHKWETGWLGSVRGEICFACDVAYFYSKQLQVSVHFIYLNFTHCTQDKCWIANRGKKSLEALWKLPSVNDALHSTLNHMVGHRVIKIWVKFKLPLQLTPESPSGCNTGLEYHHASKLGSTTQE